MFAKSYLYPFLGMLLAAPAWSQSEPVKVQPGAIKVYKDWVVGCDNTFSCEAISLMPETGEAEGGEEMAVTRAAGATGAVEMRFTFDSRSKAAVSIAVDDRVLATVEPSAEGEALVAGQAALALARALAQGRVLEVKQGTKVIAQPSLAGASAALRYMDAQQHRAGTVTALVASGPKPASAVPAAPATPTLLQARVTSKADPMPLTSAESTQAIKTSGCEQEEDEASETPMEIPLNALDAERSLVLVPCGQGAYNFNSVVLIARGKPGSRTFTMASFDNEPSPRDPSWLPLVTNADWNPATASLSSYSKGRGLGDCGEAQTYTWDGNRLRLTAESIMPECRGSQSMITTWRTDSR